MPDTSPRPVGPLPDSEQSDVAIFGLRLVAVALLAGVAGIAIWARRSSAEWNIPWIDHIPAFLLEHPLAIPTVAVSCGVVAMVVGPVSTWLQHPIRFSAGFWMAISLVIVVAMLVGVTLFALAPASTVVNDWPVMDTAPTFGSTA